MDTDRAAILYTSGSTGRLAQLGAAQGRRPTVAVRVNPDFELKAAGMEMSGGPKPFEVDAERVPALLRALAAVDLELVGFHIFTGSQNLRAEARIEAQAHIFALADTLTEHAPAPVRTLNIGGGFGIPYFPGDQRLDPARVVSTSPNGSPRPARDCRRPGSCSSWAAPWSARRATTCARSSTARTPAGRCASA